MNVVPFYLFVGAVLGGIFLFFKPLHVEIAKTEELAQIELNRFLVHEVTPEGVKTILGGTHAQRFKDRYVVEDINLTDRSGRFEENMKADRGTYKGSVITLDDNVRYRRDDGIAFRCMHAVYDQNTSMAETIGAFDLWQGGDRISGRNLRYNSRTGDVFAKDVVGYYRIKDRS